MSELQRDNPETPEQQTTPVNYESERPIFTTDAEVLIELLRDGRRRGFSPCWRQIWEHALIDRPEQVFRELRGRGFKIRYRLEWLDDDVKLSYDLVFDPDFDVA